MGRQSTSVGCNVAAQVSKRSTHVLARTRCASTIRTARARTVCARHATACHEFIRLMTESYANLQRNRQAFLEYAKASKPAQSGGSVSPMLKVAHIRSVGAAERPNHAILVGTASAIPLKQEPTLLI